MDSSNKQVGFIGLGNMGIPMANNLIAAGYKLTVYNRTPDKAGAVTAQGAQQVFQPVDVVQPGGIVITMVANDRALEEMVTGENGFLDRLGQGGIHISMSTVSPETSRRLAQLQAKHGSFYLAAPVLGRPEAAAARQLRILLSGDPTAREQARPILEALGTAIFEYGDDPGAANVAKLAVNFLIASAMEAMSEAFVLVEKQGLDPTAVHSMLAQSLFACTIYQNYGKTIVEKRFAPAGFQLDLGLKDINLVLQAAGTAQVPMPYASLVHDRLVSGLAKGRGTLDWAALSLGVAEDAGLDT